MSNDMNIPIIKILQMNGGAAGLYELLIYSPAGQNRLPSMGDDFEAIHDPSSSSTALLKEGQNLRQVMFQTDILYFMDIVSVPISDNIKRNNMSDFSNQPELMKQCSKGAGVQIHIIILIAQ